MSNQYSPDNYGDDIFDDIEKERKAASNKRDDNQIKLEKEGDLWMIRFLPARLGERNTFFARIAQHWVNKRPHFCARSTPPECGGNPDSHCPLCDLSEQFRENSNRDISTVGYKASANSQWLTYALVWSKESKGQEPFYPEGDEQWTPYRFWLNKTNFTELVEYWKRYRDRLAKDKNPSANNSILDPEIGVDFVVKRANNKIGLQKDESRSIFPHDYTKEDRVNLMAYIHSRIKMPTYRPLGSDEMDAACQKLEEAVRRVDVTPTRRPAPRQTADEAPAPRASARPPAPRPSAPAPRPQQHDNMDDDEAPVPRASAPRVPAPRPQLPPAAPRSVPSARPAPRVQAPAPSDDDDVPFEFEEPAAEAPTAPPVQTPSNRLRQAARQVAEPEAPRSSGVSSVDDDDDVTDEVRDPVPQASVDHIEDAPPAPVEKVQTRPASRMSDKLRSAISRTQQ
jgi:hypothetical protein